MNPCMDAITIQSERIYSGFEDCSVIDLTAKILLLVNDYSMHTRCGLQKLCIA